MSVGRCHSAFQHYEMFHGHGACHGGGNNYGSIFNINYNCRGGHANFWSGLATGLGYGIGNWFMGGLNMVGGWLGLGGGMNFGGWMGMPMMSSMGGWLGGNNVSNSRSNQSEKVTERVIEREKTDADYGKINNLADEVAKLEQDPDRTQADIDNLLKAIDEFEKADDINTKENDDHLEDLKNRLNKLKATKTETETRTNAGTNNSADNGAVNLDDVDDIETLMQKLPEGGYDKLSDEDKAAFDKKLGELLKGMSDDDKVALLAKVTDPAVRTKIKASFYKDGYTNYDGSEELKNGDIILANDVSGKTRDTVMVNSRPSDVTKAENGNHPETIVIHDTKDITYAYKETKDGEYIYVSNQDRQEYVLQKKGDEYYLQQYAYHEGYGKSDWSHS